MMYKKINITALLILFLIINVSAQQSQIHFFDIVHNITEVEQNQQHQARGRVLPPLPKADIQIALSTDSLEHLNKIFVIVGQEKDCGNCISEIYTIKNINGVYYAERQNVFSEPIEENRINLSLPIYSSLLDLVWISIYGENKSGLYTEHYYKRID